MLALSLISAQLIGLGLVLQISATWLVLFSRKPLNPAMMAVAFAAGLAQIIVGAWLAGVLP